MSLTRANGHICRKFVDYYISFSVMPATNVTTKGFFGALRRVETYLKTTMTQERFNYLMLLHVQQTMLI